MVYGIRRLLPNPRVMGSNPTVGKRYFFYSVILIFFKFLAAQLSPYKCINHDIHLANIMFGFGMISIKYRKQTAQFYLTFGSQIRHSGNRPILNSFYLGDITIDLS